MVDVSRGPDSKVTVRDVARAAGVSVASVSRALSGSRQVGADVARAVKEASAALGYRPDHLARALSVGRTSSVGLVVPDIASAFFPALADAVERTLRPHGLTLLLANAQNDVDHERECVELMLARRIDGLLISPTHRHHSRETVERAARRVPVVQVDRHASAKVSRVVTDPKKTIALALDHLQDQNRTAVAFVGADRSTSVAAARLRAYQKQSARRWPSEEVRILTGDFTVDWGFEAARVLLERWPEVDAVVCANDLIALGLIQGLQALGREVPRDVSVTGCDDTFFAAVSKPTVTSVAQPLGAVAEQALELLTTGGGPGASPKLISLAPTLHVRDSSLKPGRVLLASA